MMNVDDAIQLADEILADIPDVPERGAEFAESVAERTSSIKAWIEKNQWVTDRQSAALENMRFGLDRWLKLK
jgi:hypothetical protein